LNHAIIADASIRRLHAGDCADGSRMAYRASSICPGRAHRQPGRNGGSRAAARRAGAVVGMPRVQRGGKWRGRRGSTVCEFMQCCLAETYASCGFQLIVNRRIVRRYPIGQQIRVSGCAYAFRPHNVFMRDGNAMKRSAIIAGRDFTLGAFCLLEREVTGDGDIAM